MKFRLIPSNDEFFVLFGKAASNLAATATAFKAVLADFGNPRQSTNYVLCIWDGSQTLVSATRIPAGGTCKNGVECWKQSSTYFQYKDDDLTPDGVQQVRIGRDPAPVGRAVEEHRVAALLE